MFVCLKYAAKANLLLCLLIGPHVSQDHREATEGSDEQLSRRPVSSHSCRLYEEGAWTHRED
jgi:hypothetical protein